MARDPGSLWKPLPEAGAPDGYTKTQFIVHSTGTMASAAANWGYFSRGDVVVESTFIIGLSPDDPTLQIMDSTDNADANGSANRRGISVEVVGDGVGPYTDWQISELIRIGRWAAAEHPIERRVIPSEAASGFGWHVMFGAPGPWTSVRGKVCPGNARIGQLQSVVFPAIFAGLSPAAPALTPAEIEENELMAARDDILAAIAADGERTRKLIDSGVIARVKNLYSPLRIFSAKDGEEAFGVWLLSSDSYGEIGPKRYADLRADGVLEVPVTRTTHDEMLRIFPRPAEATGEPAATPASA